MILVCCSDAHQPATATCPFAAITRRRLTSLEPENVSPSGTGAVFDAGAAAGFRQARREPSVPHNDHISMFIRSAPINASLSYRCRTGSFTDNVGSVLVIWIVMFLSRPCRHHHAISESQLAFRDSTTPNAQPRGDGDGYGYRRANSCWTN